ncbi:alpha/beta hydrolase, partial [Streptomyces cinnamoneus]|uniref:alpha/beta fold hydrolase n=1 Tax=Streptomyces cinnamoneus TaxID=53446 RepID=UPI00341AA562
STHTTSGSLAGGLPLLRGIDSTGAVRRHPGPLLSIVGGASRLVARRHVAVAAGPHHRVQVVPGSGMRPHTENTAEVSAAVTAFVETFLQQKEA